MPYLFRDTHLAAQRLEVLAEVFADSTRAFLLETGARRPNLCIDLGCGPGYTTGLLAQTLHGDQTVGLDNSEYFIKLAQMHATVRVSFYRHDITTIPFPRQGSDLMYCRFLLTHLDNPQAVVAKWATQLRPTGLLLMEETEWIHTENKVFATYLEILQAMLAHQANDLYVGQVLHRLAEIPHLQRVSSQVRRLGVTNARAATMFALNLQAWQQQQFVRTHYASMVIDRLAAELQALSQDPSCDIEIEWVLRQLAFARR